MSSKKINWAQMDKRIRGRKPDWTSEELKALELGLSRLPDAADLAETIGGDQPAINPSGASPEGSSQASNADEAS